MIDFERSRSDRTGYLYQQMNDNLNFQRHTHRSFELIVVFAGELICEADRREYILREHAGMLILPGQIHSYRTETGSRSYLCVFSNDWVRDFYQEVKGYAFENPFFSVKDETVFRQLYRNALNPFLIRSVLYGICGKVYADSGLVRVNEADYILTNAIASYIESHYLAEITLKDMAGEMGYSYGYLSSFFNAHFGVNFSAYVNRCRVQLAREYLLETDREITEISLLCGFASIRNFNRIFKEESGLSPSEYRKRERKRSGFFGKTEENS